MTPNPNPWALPDELADNPFTLEAGLNRLTGVIPSSGGWDKWPLRKFGTLKVQAGRGRVVLRPDGPIHKELCDLTEIWLVPPADRDRRLKIPPRKVSGNQPRPVKPRQDGSLVLEPATCEIYGARITVNPELDVLVWHFNRKDDRVVWSVEVAKEGGYEVWIEWAQIDEYADNPFAVEVEGSGRRVTGRLPSTGGWEKYQKKSFGTLQLDAGRQRIVIRADGPIKEELSDLHRIRLAPLGPNK